MPLTNWFIFQPEFIPIIFAGTPPTTAPQVSIFLTTTALEAIITSSAICISPKTPAHAHIVTPSPITGHFPLSSFPNDIPIVVP